MPSKARDSCSLPSLSSLHISASPIKVKGKVTTEPVFPCALDLIWIPQNTSEHIPQAVCYLVYMQPCDPWSKCHLPYSWGGTKFSPEIYHVLLQPEDIILSGNKNVCDNTFWKFSNYVQNNFQNKIICT